MTDEAADLVITGCTALVHGEQEQIEFLDDATIVVRDGVIAPGRRADITLVDLTGPHTQPVHDLAATFVHSARSSDVRTTIVDGRVLMRDRQLLTIDVQAVVRVMGERMPALLDRSHGRRIQDYNP